MLIHTNVRSTRRKAQKVSGSALNNVDSLSPGDVMTTMIDSILKREGGFVDHPNDRGGPTNFGITQRSLARWRGADVSRDDVHRMTQDEARAIYRSTYFTQPKIDQLPALVQAIVFDMAINHGPATAIRLLQEVVNAAGFPCAQDGAIGNKTITAVSNACAAIGKLLINKLVDQRVKLYESIVAGDASQAVFLKGWLRRADAFRQA